MDGSTPMRVGAIKIGLDGLFRKQEIEGWLEGRGKEVDLGKVGRRNKDEYDQITLYKILKASFAVSLVFNDWAIPPATDLLMSSITWAHAIIDS